MGSKMSDGSFTYFSASFRAAGGERAVGSPCPIVDATRKS
jgi:hypothetical protein